MTAALTAAQKRYLSRRECSWCNQRLDRGACGAIYEACDFKAKVADCLSHHKPRSPELAKDRG